MPLQIEVIADSSELKNINDKEGRLVGFNQEIYFKSDRSHFPEKAFVRVEKPLQSGLYLMYPEYRTNKYSQIEINPYSFPRIEPVTKQVPKAV